MAGRASVSFRDSLSLFDTGILFILPLLLSLLLLARVCVPGKPGKFSSRPDHANTHTCAEQGQSRATLQMNLPSGHEGAFCPHALARVLLLQRMLLLARAVQYLLPRRALSLTHARVHAEGWSPRRPKHRCASSSPRSCPSSPPAPFPLRISAPLQMPPFLRRGVKRVCDELPGWCALQSMCCRQDSLVGSLPCRLCRAQAKAHTGLPRASNPARQLGAGIRNPAQHLSKSALVSL